MAYSTVLCGDPADQWDWHEAHRDSMKNMYRTSYQDATHFREVHVKSDMPAGYGGHSTSLRFDVLHRNTSFDRNALLKRTDPSRDAFPSFVDHIAGIPTATQYPEGAKKNPTYGVIPHNSKTATPKPPWGQQIPYHREPLNHRYAPPTMTRTQSLPQMGLSRANTAAVNAGSMLAADVPNTQYNTPQYQHGESVPPLKRSDKPSNGALRASPMSDHLRRTVNTANEQAQRGRMPTESEVLAEQMQAGMHM